MLLGSNKKIVFAVGIYHSVKQLPAALFASVVSAVKALKEGRGGGCHCIFIQAAFAFVSLDFNVKSHVIH